MQEKEKIKVFINYKDGKVFCICKRSRKKCKKKCSPEVVERDRFYGWQNTLYQDRYGKVDYHD